MTRYGCHATCPGEQIWQCGRWSLFLVTSLPAWKRQQQHKARPLTQRERRERGDNVPSQCDTQTEAQTRCDERHNGRTNSEQQLNGSSHNVLPGLRAQRLRSGSNSVALPGCSSAARQLAAPNRADAPVWATNLGLTITVGRLLKHSGSIVLIIPVFCKYLVRWPPHYGTTLNSYQESQLLNVLCLRAGTCNMISYPDVAHLWYKITVTKLHHCLICIFGNLQLIAMDVGEE